MTKLSQALAAASAARSGLVDSQKNGRRRDEEPLLRREFRRVLKRGRAIIRPVNPSDQRICFIFGCQRSGTTMLQQSLFDSAWHVYSLDEHDARIVDFEDPESLRLRRLDLVERSLRNLRFHLLVAKPLVESHRVSEVLDGVSGSVGIWLLRSPLSVARSNLAKFGATQGHTDLRKLLTMRQDWRAQVSSSTYRTVERLVERGLSDLDAAALFWWVRNSLYFDQALEEDARVRVLRYEDLIEQLPAVTPSLESFVGTSLPLRSMLRRLRPPARSTGTLSGGIEELCVEMHSRFDSLPTIQPSQSGRLPRT